jgi:transcriptional repressor NrdR
MGVSDGGFRIGDSKVVESRESADGKVVRRCRVSPDGKHRFTTYERIEKPTLIVRKRNGKKEAFDREKLLSAARRSVGKFFDSELEVDAVVGKVEDSIFARGEDEVESAEIGEAMLDVLAEVNEVAFVRFASVFREFTSLEDFMEIIKSRKKKNVSKS